MNIWLDLNDEMQLDELINHSTHSPVVIFKHSTTCSISSIAKKRIENQWTESNPIYYLDLLNYRKISNQVAEKFSVHHESPQILVIKNGKCIYDESHLDINVDEIRSYLN